MGTRVGPKEKFGLEVTGKNLVSFVTYDKKYVSCNGSKDTGVRADKTVHLDFE
jgi:hypothetical protein